jgi:hypothetical protein
VPDPPSRSWPRSWGPSLGWATATTTRTATSQDRWPARTTTAASHIPEPFIEPPSLDIGHPDTQGKPLISQPAGGVLTRADQGRADPAPLQRPHDLTSDPAAGPREGTGGPWARRLAHAVDTHPHGTLTQPGDQQHATPLVLSSQAVNEEGALPECFHKGGKLGISARPDLQLRTHRAQPSQLVAPVHLVSPCGKPRAATAILGTATAILGTATMTRATRPGPVASSVS